MLLPTPLSDYLEKLKKIFSTYIRKRYLLGIIVDVLCLVFVLSQGMNQKYSILSPLGTPPLIKQINADKHNFQTFSFIPGWTSSKLDDIEVDNADIFAFFDIPVLADGTLYRDTAGYNVFTSYKAHNLFQRIKENNKQIVLTLTQSDNQEIIELIQNTNSQKTLTEEAVNEVAASGIDGINIDFEFTGSNGSLYRNQFNEFIKRFTHEMRLRIPDASITISMPNTAPYQPFYDISTLSQHTDKVLLMAYDFAVPESHNKTATTPVYGYEKSQYWNTVSKSYTEFLQLIPSQKITLEAAWYGNGNQYPFYGGNKEIIDNTIVRNDLKIPLSQDTIERILINVPIKAKAAARKNLPFIAKALEKEKILNSNVLAYALATIEHETAGTFEPIEEFKGRKSARRLGYEGGTHYFGRGFIQLTHLRNYLKVGKRIGIGEQLAKNPDLALNSDISAKILAAFFKDNGIARLASDGYFIAARTPVNPDYQGYYIASLALGYQSRIY